MKYAFYPGCVSRGGCPELYPAALKVAGKLGIELEELTDVGCTGAGVLPTEISDPINARTLARAEALGLPLMTICSTCQGVISQANHRLKADQAYREEINRRFLGEEGLAYGGTVEVKHLLWVVMEDCDREQVRSLVLRPLAGFKVSPFYGCYLRRPGEIMVPKGYEGRRGYLEQLVELLGGEARPIAGGTKCCGFPVVAASERNSLEMAGDHTLEARAKGADCMVTPCPLCHLSLDGNQPRAAAQKREKIDLPVLHLPQMLGLAFGFDPEDLGLQRHIVDTGRIRRRARELPLRT